MNTDSILAFTPLVAGVFWYGLFERIPFEKLGSLNQVLEVLNWESHVLQANYLAQFSMSRYQWFIMNHRHANRVQMSLGLSGMQQAGFSQPTQAALRARISIKR